MVFFFHSSFSDPKFFTADWKAARNVLFYKLLVATLFSVIRSIIVFPMINFIVTSSTVLYEIDLILPFQLNTARREKKELQLKLSAMVSQRDHINKFVFFTGFSLFFTSTFGNNSFDWFEVKSHTSRGFLTQNLRLSISARSTNQRALTKKIAASECGNPRK